MSSVFFFNAFELYYLYFYLVYKLLISGADTGYYQKSYEAVIGKHPQCISSDMQCTVQQHRR